MKFPNPNVVVLTSLAKIKLYLKKKTFHAPETSNMENKNKKGCKQNKENAKITTCLRHKHHIQYSLIYFHTVISCQIGSHILHHAI